MSQLLELPLVIAGGVGDYPSIGALPANPPNGSIAEVTGTLYIAYGGTWSAVGGGGGGGITALTGDVTASGTGSVPATVALVGGSSAANVHAAELLANAATNANTASTIVKRDASGNFTAGTITAALTGTASGNPPNSRTISTTAPLTGGGDLSANRTLSMSAATTSVDGYLTATDWTTFNGKQPAGTYLTPTSTNTVSNKTLDNSTVLTIKDANFTLQDDGDTTKQAKFELSGITTATTRTYTLPDSNQTLVGTTAPQQLLNKTLTSSNVNDALIFDHTGTPVTPSAGKVKVYAKSDNQLRLLDSGGNEHVIIDDFSSQAITNKTINGSANTITNINLTSAVTSTLPIGNGGTGQSTQQAAINTLTGSQSNGKYLRSDGTNATLSSLAAADLTGTVAIANGGTGQTTANPAFNALAPTTTKGDLIAYSTVNARLPVGTNGQVLTADSTQTTGIKWATPASSATSGSWTPTITAVSNVSTPTSNCAFYNQIGNIVSFTIYMNIASSASGFALKFSVPVSTTFANTFNDIAGSATVGSGSAGQYGTGYCYFNGVDTNMIEVQFQASTTVSGFAIVTGHYIVQ